LFAPIRTLDGFIQSALARSTEWRLYRHPVRDRNGEVVKWINPPNSIELLRALVCQQHGVEYSTDPYNIATGNKIFHVFDFVINAYPAPKLSEAMQETEALFRRLDIHPKAPYVIKTYLEYLLKRRSVDFTLGRRIVWRHGLRYQHCVGKGRSKRCWTPDAVFLDEAQDLSPLFWLDVTTLFPNVSVVIIAADDDQLVYDSLHGADVRYLLNIARDLKEGRLRGPPPIVLRQSHRVAEPVAAFAREVISRVKDRWPKEWVGRDAVATVKKIPEREALELIKRLAELYEERLRSLVDQRTLEHNSILILAPTNAEVYEWFFKILSIGYVPASLKVSLAPAVRAALRAV
jgi:hypothetical protein